MGKEAIGKDGRIDEKQGKAGGDTGRSSGSASSTDARTRAGGDTRTGGDTGGDPRAEKEQVQKPEVLAIEKLSPVPVSIEKTEEQKKEERNAKRRERYAKQKAENGSTVRPRKKKDTKTSESAMTAVQINATIVALSAYVASRPGMEHWLMTNEEVESITKPLLNIIEKNDSLSKVLEHSDGIALFMACVTVLVPRIFITTTKIKEKKKDGNGRTTDVQRRATVKKGTTEKSNVKPINKPTTNHQDDGRGLSFLGDALAR